MTLVDRNPKLLSNFSNHAKLDRKNLVVAIIQKP